MPEDDSYVKLVPESTCDHVDWNDDGVIDDLDLTILANNWQKPVGPSTDGDANGDALVNDIDLTALAVCWPGGLDPDASGTRSGGDISAVPEPATLSLLSLAGLGMLLHRRRK